MICIFVGNEKSLQYTNKPNRFQHYFFARICLQPWPHVYVNIRNFVLYNIRIPWAKPSTSPITYSEKIYPLFGQILITCLKCSRASFLSSSYSEKMHWERGLVNIQYVFDEWSAAGSSINKTEILKTHWTFHHWFFLKTQINMFQPEYDFLRGQAPDSADIWSEALQIAIPHFG